MRPHYFLGADRDRPPEPDQTIAIDDLATRRVRDCLLCGRLGESARVWLRHQPPLAMAFALCARCQAAPEMTERVDRLLTARYQHL